MEKEILALLITDTHLTSTNCEFVKDIFHKAKEICEKEKIRRIIHLGDFFDNRAFLTYEVIKAGMSIFEELSSYSGEVYLLTGNHDRPYIGREGYLSLFQNYYNIKIYDSFEKESTEKVDFYFLPHYDKYLKDEEKNIIDIIKSSKTSNKKILFAHHQYTEIPTSIQSLFDLILMGHLHDKEQINDKACYIGSAYQQNFSEDSNKGFSILYSDLSIKQIKTNFKEYIIQKVDLNFFSETEVKDFILDFKNKNPDKFLRIVLEGNNKNIVDIKEFCKNLGIDVVSEVKNIVELREENTFQLSQFSQKQISDFLNKFLENNQVNDDVKQNLQNIFKELYK